MSDALNPKEWLARQRALDSARGQRRVRPVQPPDAGLPEDEQPIEALDPRRWLEEQRHLDDVFAQSKRELDIKAARERIGGSRGLFPLEPTPHVLDLNAPHSPHISPTRAALLGFSQAGSLGHADEIGSAIASARSGRMVTFGPGMQPADDDTPDVRRIKEEALAQQAEGLLRDPLSRRNFRDTMRQEAAQARADQPPAYLGGELLGATATGAFPGGGLGAVGRMGGPLGSIAGGAIYSALQGAGDSEAELMDGEALRFGTDVGQGLVMGTAGALAGAKSGVKSPAALRVAGNKLEDMGINQGRRHILAGADSLSTRKELPAEAVRAALDEGAIRPFGKLEGTFRRLDEAAEHWGDTYAEIVATLEKNGVEGPDAQQLAKAILDKRKQIRPGELDEGVLGEYEQRAEQVLDRAGVKPKAAGGHGHHGAPKPAEPELVDEFGRPFPKTPAVLPNKRLGLTQAEDIKRSLQRKAKYGRYEDTPLNDARKDIASIVRQANEDAIDEAAQRRGGFVAEVAEDFKPVKRKTGALITARDAAERGQAKASGRSSGAMPGAVDVATATMSGNPLALARAPLAAVAKARGPATMSRLAYDSGKGVNALGRAAGRIAESTRASTGAGVGGALARFIDSDAQPGVSPKADRTLSAAEARPDSVSQLARRLREDPGAFGRYTSILLDAAEEGLDALIVAHAVFGSEPEYQAALAGEE